MQVSITSNHNRNIGGKQTGNIAHNRRGVTPHNVDPALTVNNIVYKDRDISEVFIESFKQAIDEYNKKQKLKDRIKYDGESYFEHLFGVKSESESAKVILISNARGKHEIKSFNEELFQVGDCYEFGHFIRDNHGNLIDKNGDPVKRNEKDNTYYDINGKAVTDSSCLVPNPKSEKVREILSAFYMGGRFKVVNDPNGISSLKRLEENDTDTPDLLIPSFEERNPNFRIIYAVMHNDEWHGTPHIHIDYVPVGEGYIKGPEKQLGFERALKNMGFEDKNTTYKEWREKERQILKKICNYYGLKTKTKEEELENNRGKTYSTTEYKKIVRTACADTQKIREQALMEADEIRNRALDEINKLNAQVSNLQEKESEMQTQISDNNKKLDRQYKEMNECEKQVKYLKSKVTELKTAENEAVEASAAASNKANELNAQINNLQVQISCQNEILEEQDKEVIRRKKRIDELDVQLSKKQNRYDLLQAGVTELIELCSDFTNVIPKDRKFDMPILIGKGKIADIYRIHQIVNKVTANKIASDSKLRAAEEMNKAADENYRKSEELLRNEENLINKTCK